MENCRAWCNAPCGGSNWPIEFAGFSRGETMSSGAEYKTMEFENHFWQGQTH